MVSWENVERVREYESAAGTCVGSYLGEVSEWAINLESQMPNRIVMECPIGQHIVMLQEASQKHGEWMLPTEICLAILLRWGGLRHPTADLFQDAEFRYTMLGCSLVANGDGGHECVCGMTQGGQGMNSEARHMVSPLRYQADTFRPTRGIASHVRRITLNAEGGYRSRHDLTLDRFGQAWVLEPYCSLKKLWWRVWKHREGVMLPWVYHTREFSLVEFLRRAPHDRLEIDLAEFIGDPVLDAVTNEEREWLCSPYQRTDQYDSHDSREARMELVRAYMHEKPRDVQEVGVGDWIRRIKPRTASEAATAPKR